MYKLAWRSAYTVTQCNLCRTCSHPRLFCLHRHIVFDINNSKFTFEPSNFQWNQHSKAAAEAAAAARAASAWYPALLLGPNVWFVFLYRKRNANRNLTFAMDSNYETNFCFQKQCFQKMPRVDFLNSYEINPCNIKIKNSKKKTTIFFSSKPKGFVLNGSSF